MNIFQCFTLTYLFGNEIEKCILISKLNKRKNNEDFYKIKLKMIKNISNEA